jgi:hypothetical protein
MTLTSQVTKRAGTDGAILITSWGLFLVFWVVGEEDWLENEILDCRGCYLFLRLEHGAFSIICFQNSADRNKGYLGKEVKLYNVHLDTVSSPWEYFL